MFRLSARKKCAKLFLFVYLAVFMFELFMPLYSVALTSGPAQPEAEGFTPAGTSDMVNTFSGDFNYNIPLFELPGPNGGYPFNLAYQAGVTMDQEASWVGLGWNLNPGAINRDMRGLPDDFNGDIIKTDIDIKKNYTAGVNLSFSPELWSFDFAKGGLTFSLGVRYNSYKGFGASTSVGGNSSIGDSGDGGSVTGSVGLGVSFDSDEGAGADVSLGLGGKVGKGDNRLDGSVGMGVNSRSGLKQLSLGLSGTKYKQDDKNGNTFKNSHGVGGSGNISFSSPAFTPAVQMPMKGYNVSVNFKVGGDIGGTFLNVGIGGSYSEQKLKEKQKKSKAYGYLHLQHGEPHATDKSGTLMDFNREKDGMVTRFTPNLAAPHLTYDVYNVNGQGMMEQFRPYRNDIGAIFDEYAKTTNTGGGIGAEVGVGVPIHWGINGDINHAESWSGKWVKRNNFAYGYTDKEQNSNYEPVYFRSTGEHTAESSSRMQNIIGDDHAMKLNLTGNRDVPELTNTFSNFNDNDLASQPSDNASRKSVDRKPRNNNLSILKNSEVSTLREFDVFDYSAPSSDYRSATKNAINRTSRNGYSSNMPIADQIGGMIATNKAGMRYVYGMPAYNTKHVECSFSINPELADTFCKRTSTIQVQDNDVKYKWRGTDEYKKRTNMPPYAHSYLLTSILGSDYVDVDNDGPSDDDLGYWVKFNYVKTSNAFRWRAPYEYNKANYIGGYKSDKYDDKGTYMYGEKEIRYLATAETKTHIAVFIISARHDGRDAAAEFASTGATTYSQSYKLDRIDLYSKEDYKRLTNPKPLQSVHFKYDYELCGNVPNNDHASQWEGTQNLNANAGKLTLKSLYFTHENSTRGVLTPYKFTYGKVETSGGAIVSNPDYSPFSYDRWGQYSPSANNGVSDCSKVIFPYVNQGNSIDDSQNRVVNASAWNLTDIHMPSGSDIHVNFEQDDYAYVQNKTAMQMFKIESLGDHDPTDHNSLIYTNDSNRFAEDEEDRRIYFRLEYPISTALSSPNRQLELEKYLDENRQLYFKVYAPMRKHTESFWEYVSGYMDIESIGVKEGTDSAGYYNYAFVVVKRMTKSNNRDIPYHPLTVAILQSLKQNLPQFAFKGGLTMSNPSAEGAELILEMGKALGAAFATLKELFTSFYRDRTNGVHRWADRIDLEQSFIRLNSPDKKKYGGGIRVNRIEIRDNWSVAGEAQSVYGQEYDYTHTENGQTISSGVATYEPAIGGEENALRYAKQYPFKVSVTTESNMFYEYPINETVYPGPSVGYGKVTVRSINTKRIMDGQTTATGYGSTGVTENYFYTAKDYPIISEETKLFPKMDSKSMKFLNLPIPLPGLGSLSWEIMAASQGYLTQLNDMHGKPWKIINYGLDNTGHKTKEPISSVLYEYFDEEKVFFKPGTHTPIKYRVLKNEVPVLISDPNPENLEEAKIETKTIGVDYEVLTDQRQSYSYNVGAGVSFNIEQMVFLPFPFPWPNINYGETEISLAVTNKIIHRSGILKKTIATDGQSIVTTENKCFDRYTGEPLLTTVTNDFDDNIWKYDIPGHVKYDGMGAAYQNNNSEVTFADTDFSLAYPSTSNDSTFLVNHTGIEALFAVGDEVIFMSSSNIRGVVEEVGLNYVRLTVRKSDAVSSFPTGATSYKVKVVRSGRRNMLETKVGSIVALKDPTKGRLVDTCRNFDVVEIADPNGNAFDCMKDLAYIATLVDTITSRARNESEVSDVYIPFTDPFFSSSGTSNISNLISMGYVGIMANCQSNKIVFKNTSGTDCTWYFYSGHDSGSPITTANGSTNGAPTPVSSICNVAGADFFPFNAYDSAFFPLYYNGGTYSGNKSDNVVYQNPSNCFCQILFNPIVYDTTYYTDTIVYVDSVINTSAAVYTDEWPNDFLDARFSGTDSLERAYELSSINDFVTGRKGVWRNWLTFAYHTDRRQTLDNVDLRTNGTFFMSLFDWRKPLLRHCDSSWVKVNEITRYNSYNYEVENVDPLNIYSAALYGYKGKLPIAIGANAKYGELGFESFEEYNAGQLYNEYSATSGNVTLTTQTVNLATCSTGYNIFKFYARNFGSLSAMRIYNYIVPNGFANINDISIDYVSGHSLLSMASILNYNFTDHNGGNLTNVSSLGFGRFASGVYAPSTPISYSYYSGRVKMPYCIPIPTTATDVTEATVVATKAHTGKKSIKISDEVSYKQLFLRLGDTKKYEFSAWVSRDEEYTDVSSYKLNNTVSDDNLKVEVYACDDNWNEPVLMGVFYPTGAMINKWQKIEGTFTMPYITKNNVLLKIYPGKVSGVLRDIYLDDVRVFPSKGNMVSYVYNKDNYRLAAQLDNNNYATFFYYDEEGKLYLKKQETEKGIYTIQESRTHVPKP